MPLHVYIRHFLNRLCVCVCFCNSGFISCHLLTQKLLALPFPAFVQAALNLRAAVLRSPYRQRGEAPPATTETTETTGPLLPNWDRRAEAGGV